MTSTAVHDVVGIRQVVPMRRQIRIAVEEWLRAHRRSLVVLLPLLALVGVVHAKGMAGYPRWVDDPGTYLSQAWSFQYERALSPYSYFYDHAPAGWMQLGAYPFQLVLSAAAVWATVRFALGRNNWVKTAHRGAHLEPVDVGGVLARPREAA